MGCYGLLRALQRIAADPEKLKKVKFDKIVLRIPDVDREHFVNLAPRLNIGQICKNVTLLTTDDHDKWIYISNSIHKYNRAGWHDGNNPLKVVGMDTVKIDETESTNSQPTVAELLKALEAAVHTEDRVRATELEEKILCRLFIEATDRDCVKHQARALLAELDRSQAEPHPIEPGLAGSVSGSKPVKVWFGTNRNYKKDEAELDFTGERDPNGITWYGTLDFNVEVSSAKVQAPVADNIGETGTDESSEQIQPVPELKLEVTQGQLLKHDDFFKQIEADLEVKKAAQLKELNSLVFLHGYNTGFDSATKTAAVLSAGLELNGVTAIYSWPSIGYSVPNLLRYPLDGANIEASEKAIADFLRSLAITCGKYGKLHVIAHSMGNRGLLRALQLIADEPSQTVKFGQIIHAAPDVDRDLFLDLTRYCFGENENPDQPKKPIEADRVTLYASNKDIAVWFSEWWNYAPRAGILPPYTENKKTFDLVVMYELALFSDTVGHGYVTASDMVRADFKRLIRRNESPKKRLGETLLYVLKPGTPPPDPEDHAA